MQKVAKESFCSGSLSLFIDQSISNDREIFGEVRARLQLPTFTRGIFVKLSGYNTIQECCKNEDNDRRRFISSKKERINFSRHDLLRGHEEYHHNGLQEVFIGFGEGDESNGLLVDVPAGLHHWKFHFVLSDNLPSSYYDGRVSVSYLITAVIDAPIIHAPQNRLEVAHFLVIGCRRVNDNAKLLGKINSNRSILKPTVTIRSQQEKQKNNKASQQGYNVLPSLLNAVSRTRPVLLMTGGGRPNQPSAKAIFPFKSHSYVYSVNCSLANINIKQPVMAWADLYVEIATRPSIRKSFDSDADIALLSTNHRMFSSAGSKDRNRRDPLEPLSFSSKKTEGVQYVHYPLWQGCRELASSTEAKEFSFDVPLRIKADEWKRCISYKPQPLPLDYSQYQRNGTIVHFSTDGPLFRYRVMLRVTVRRGWQLVSKPACGEIFILPPSAARSTSSNNQQNVAANISSTAVNPADSLTPFPRNNHLCSSNTRDSSEIEAARPPLREISNVSPSANISSTAVGAQPHTPHAPRSSTSFGNQARRSVLLPLSSAVDGNTENQSFITPRVQRESSVIEAVEPKEKKKIITPHARPTRSKYVMRVEAEALSKGPAAALIDRDEQRYVIHPSITPSRFSYMYSVGSASVIAGSPISAVLNTPAIPAPAQTSPVAADPFDVGCQSEDTSEAEVGIVALAYQQHNHTPRIRALAVESDTALPAVVPVTPPQGHNEVTLGNERSEQLEVVETNNTPPINAIHDDGSAEEHRSSRLVSPIPGSTTRNNNGTSIHRSFVRRSVVSSATNSNNRTVSSEIPSNNNRPTAIVSPDAGEFHQEPSTAATAFMQRENLLCSFESLGTEQSSIIAQNSTIPQILTQECRPEWSNLYAPIPVTSAVASGTILINHNSCEQII